MILECQVVAMHLPDPKPFITVQINTAGVGFHDRLLIENTEGLRLGDKFLLVMQPCPPTPDPKM